VLRKTPLPAAVCELQRAHATAMRFLKRDLTLLMQLWLNFPDFSECLLTRRKNCSDLQSAPFATRDTPPHHVTGLTGRVPVESAIWLAGKGYSIMS
jgi:hypothetical protein